MATAPQSSHAFLAICALVLCVLLLSLRYHTSAAFERPVHFSLLTLFETALALAIWHRTKHAHDLAPSSAVAVEWSRRVAPREIIGLVKAQPAAIVTVCALVLRIVLFWSITSTAHCAVRGVEVFLPALVAVIAAYVASEPYQLGQEAPSGSRGRGLLLSVAYAFLAFIWAYAARATLDLTTSTTTVFCPSGLFRWGAQIPISQFVAVLIDAALVVGLTRQLQNAENEGRSKYREIAKLLLFASLITAFLAIFSNHTIARGSRLDYLAIRDLALDTATASIAMVTCVYLLGTVHPCTVALIVVSTTVYTHHLFGHAMYPGPRADGLFLAATAALLGLGVLLRFEKPLLSSTSFSPSDIILTKRLTTLYAFCVGFLGAVLFAQGAFTPARTSFPQLATLIANAERQSEDWMVQANQSNTLLSASQEYERRHGIPPPPNFDQWFRYATEHESVIIDDFDQINRDLEPFWGMPPSEIREKTSHLLAYQPWLGMGGIRIRKGKVEVPPGVPGTHLWMMEALRDMIVPFAEYIPDMDLAVNINDEPRVAIPYEELGALASVGQEAQKRLHDQTSDPQSFSGKEMSHWFDGKTEDRGTQSPFFTNEIRHQIYNNYVSPTCPPDTPARSMRWWNRRDVCISCLASHGLRVQEIDHPVVINDKHATNLCQQPDLAYMHGFLLSPSAGVPTKMPFPVFSQSKISGFNDILIPSPWNFVDKVAYDEGQGRPWDEKNNTMFWRGAASDGYAADGTWHSFLRARFVHGASRFNDGNATLPDTDVGYVGKFERCHQHDCQSEKEVFWGYGREESNKQSVKFSEHWKYKHLMDMDGAGFSGRLIPFLQSKSLVYDTGIFRTWMGDRMHAWRHYVPVDVRLHEVWDLLRYFGGAGSSSDNKGGDKTGERVAEKIASEGSSWATRVLRREDMQVYLFRLLLEWGRLVDDDREKLGYSRQVKVPVELP